MAEEPPEQTEDDAVLPRLTGAADPSEVPLSEFGARRYDRMLRDHGLPLDTGPQPRPARAREHPRRGAAERALRNARTAEQREQWWAAAAFYEKAATGNHDAALLPASRCHLRLGDYRTALHWAELAITAGLPEAHDLAARCRTHLQNNSPRPNPPHPEPDPVRHARPDS